MASIDLQAALGPALFILEGGGTTEQAEQALGKTLAGLGAPAGVSTIWRLDSLTVTFLEHGRADTIVRQVAPVGLNLRRVAAAASLADRVAAGEVRGEMLATEIDRVRGIAGPSLWQVVAAATIASAAFSQTMTLDSRLAAIAGVSAFVGQIVRSLCQRKGVPRVAATGACTLVSALLATAALRLGIGAAPGPTLIASIIYAAPGMLLINGFVDMTTERFLFAGLQRLLHAGLLFLVMTLSVFVADALL